MLDIPGLLAKAMEQNASDIHLSVGQPPTFRVDGQLRRSAQELLKPEDLDELCTAIIPADRQKEFWEKGEVDFSYSHAGIGRFRVNAFRQRGTPALALRLIPFQVSTLEELNLPSVLASFCEKPHGLVVVTGPTGSGKSTTLAAMIDRINEQYNRHIVTLEDPIEFLHRHKRSTVHQREVGSDTDSFATGLRSALRQDPDVILLGEMRDLDTIQICLQAAETGHLVFTTLHTGDAASAVDRIIDVFPAGQQQQVRVQLATVLQGVVAQRLYPRMDGKGRVAACEILIATPAVRNLIRKGNTHQIVSVIQTGTSVGMQTLDYSVKELHRSGQISQEQLQAFKLERSSMLEQQVGGGVTRI